MLNLKKYAKILIDRKVGAIMLTMNEKEETLIKKASIYSNKEINNYNTTNKYSITMKITNRNISPFSYLFGGDII